jgi:acetyl-CoA acetyltransferase
MTDILATFGSLTRAVGSDTWIDRLTKSNGAGSLGLQTMCEGGGMANATIIERVT